MTLDWLRQLLGLPPGLRGHIEDTASTSTLVALAVARAAAPGRRVVALLGACALVGRQGGAGCSSSSFGRSRPTTSSGCVPSCSSSRTRARSSPRSGRRLSRPSIPSPRSPTRCAEAGVWLHVDAAYAGSAAICPELRDHFAGWERADSIVVNPHKWLGVPMDCSTLWTRRPDVLPRRVQPRPGVPPRRRGRREPQRVHPGRSAVAFARSSYGPFCAATGGRGSRTGFASTSGSPRSSKSWVRAEPGWEVVAPRHFSLVCFRLDGSDEENERLLERVNALGRGLPLAYAARRSLRAATRDRQLPHDGGRRAARLGRAQARGCGALR